MASGIYQIVNNVNGKRYIGSSVNISKRWEQHKRRFRKGSHSNPYLQNSWNKYGEHNFMFEVILLCPRDKTIENEQFFLDRLNPEYNMAKIAGGGPGLYGEDHPMYGKHLSEETRQKISETKKGENNFFYGRHLSKEHRHKISKSLYGRHLSEETKQKISDAKKGSTLSKEHRRKISNALKGKHVSKETRRKMSKAQKGKNHPMYGKHLSEETKRKMSEAKKGKKPPNWLEFTGEDIAKMKALREAGCTYKEISKKYRVSRRTITRRIKQLERK